jgi:hypothetical protein
MLVNLLKLFYHKYFFKIIFLITFIITIILAITTYNIYPRHSDLDFFLSNNKQPKHDYNISNFLDPNNYLANSDKKNTTNALVTTKKKNITTDTNKEQPDLEVLKTKIFNLESQLKKLSKEVTILKSSNIEKNSNTLSIILIELYQIKNLALLGKKFQHKIAPLIKLSINHPDIIESLSNIENLNNLTTKHQLYQLLSIDEENIIKTLNKKNYHDSDHNFSDKIKYYLSNYIKVKQIKGLTPDNPLYQIKKIRENINIDNYKMAKNILEKLSEKHSLSPKLKSSLINFDVFFSEFEKINNIILNQQQKTPIEIAL